MVVRTGFGIFYDRYQLATINRLLELDGSHGFSQIVETPRRLPSTRAAKFPQRLCQVWPRASGELSRGCEILTAR